MKLIESDIDMVIWALGYASNQLRREGRDYQKADDHKAECNRRADRLDCIWSAVNEKLRKAEK